MTQQEREQLILDLAESRERFVLHAAFQAGDLDEELQAIRKKRAEAAARAKELKDHAEQCGCLLCIGGSAATCFREKRNREQKRHESIEARSSTNR